MKKHKENECVICGKIFSTHDARVKTCSPECFKKQKSANHKKFIDKLNGIAVDVITRKCVVCGKEFNTSDKRVRTCSVECRTEYSANVKKYSLRNYHESLTGTEGVDYVTCRWCGERVRRIFGKHISTYHPERTSDDYRREFPGSPLTTSTDIANFSRNSGVHMKQEKYKKLASDNMKGERNPNHSSRTTEEERKERSPFSGSFYEKRGKGESDRLTFIGRALEGREFETRIDYWARRGMPEDEARQRVHDRQVTFSLEKCIERYGNETGLRVWKDRQEKWKSKVFNKETYIGGGTSALASNMILEVLKQGKSIDTLKFGKDEKFISDIDNDKVYKYDLTNTKNKRIIEINGVFWHCKPELYESQYFHNVKQLSAQEIWDYDKRKIEIAESYGYKVLMVWEDEYRNDPDNTIKKCVEFIYEGID